MPAEKVSSFWDISWTWPHIQTQVKTILLLVILDEPESSLKPGALCNDSRSPAHWATGTSMWQPFFFKRHLSFTLCANKINYNASFSHWGSTWVLLWTRILIMSYLTRLLTCPLSHHGVYSTSLQQHDGAVDNTGISEHQASWFNPDSRISSNSTTALKMSVRMCCF